METEYRVNEDDGFAVVTVAVLSGQLSDFAVVTIFTQDSTATGIYIITHTYRSMQILTSTMFI